MNSNTQFRGIQKTSFIDFPGKVACVLFTGGCNFHCGYCYNVSLVENTDPPIPWKEIWDFLHRRKNLLQGVVISGGEPTSAPFLPDFLRSVRKLGYTTKLDTNGYNPAVIKDLLEEGLIDYIAMDIKNSPPKYADTCGMTAMDLTRIRTTVDLIKDSGVEYEFRTTVTQSHSLIDFQEIARFTGGGKRYCLQIIHDAPTLSGCTFVSPPPPVLAEIAKTLEKSFAEVIIRA